MYCGYKYRIYPTVKQAKFLDQNFGCARFVWNYLVANFNKYGTPEFNPNPTVLEMTKEYPFLKDVISYATNCKLLDFNETKRQFFNKKRKKLLGKMKFKKRGVSHDSFRIPGQALSKNCIDWNNSRIQLTKIKSMKIVLDRKFEGKICSVTISKNKTNQYYASFLVDEVKKRIKPTEKSVGLDLGLNDLVITSDGIKFENPKFFRKNQAKLKRAQQHFSRKLKESKRRTKQKLKVTKIHQKIARQRSWWNHNISRYLVNAYGSIFAENLNVSEMMKNKRLSKSIQDAGWSSLISMIKYKSDWAGRDFHQVDRYFASTKTCHVCGDKTVLNLGDRIWSCSGCSTVHDRDINAAFNILRQGNLELYGVLEDLSEKLPDYSRGEIVRLGAIQANFVETIREPAFNCRTL